MALPNPQSALMRVSHPSQNAQSAQHEPLRIDEKPQSALQLGYMPKAVAQTTLPQENEKKSNRQSALGKIRKKLRAL